MKHFIRACCVLLALASPALAQGIGGNASISASGSSARVAIPAAASKYPALLIAPATGTGIEVFYKLGDSTVTAATTDPALPSGGICVQAGPNTYVAAVTGGSSATVRITQLSTCTLFSGGGGGGSIGSVTQGTVPWVDIPTGFHVDNYGTPISATSGSGVTGSIPSITGSPKELVAWNVGTYGAFCKLGATSGTDGAYLSPNGGYWVFGISAETQVTCQGVGGTTTINLGGGSGAVAGTGGGGGSTGAVFGPTGHGSAAANPPVLMGGTADGSGTGNVGNWKVDANGWGFVDISPLSEFASLIGQGAYNIGSAIASNGSTIAISGKDGSGNAQPLNMTNWGIAPGAIAVPNVNANVLASPVNNGLICSGCTASYGSATGTTGAVTATLAAVASVTQYVCGISIRANATAAVTGNATLSDGTKTYNFMQWVAPAASGIGVVEEVFPGGCRPASAVNTAWTLTSYAAGTGGNASATIWGFYK